MWKQVVRLIPRSVKKAIGRNLPAARHVGDYLLDNSRYRAKRAHKTFKNLASKVRREELADFRHEEGRLYIKTFEGIHLWFREDSTCPVLYQERRTIAFEQRELEHLKALSTENRTIFDIGAGCGFHALTLARKNPNLTVHAFEPSPITFEMLTENIKFNQAFSGVTPYNKAIGAEPGTVKITNQGNHFDYVTSKGDCSVECSTVDAEVLRLGDSVDGIKIDVEGYELQILKGAHHTLGTHKPWICCELEQRWTSRFGYSEGDLIEFLKSYGYRVYWIDSRSGLLVQTKHSKTQANNILALMPHHRTYLQGHS